MSRQPEIEESFARGEFQEGESFIGTLADIKAASERGAKGNSSVGIICYETKEGMAQAWQPLEAGHSLKPGDTVRVTKYTRYHESGGSLTISKVTLVNP